MSQINQNKKLAPKNEPMIPSSGDPANYVFQTYPMYEALMKAENTPGRKLPPAPRKKPTDAKRISALYHKTIPLEDLLRMPDCDDEFESYLRVRAVWKAMDESKRKLPPAPRKKPTRNSSGDSDCDVISQSPIGYRKPAQTKRPRRKCLPRSYKENSSDSSDCEVISQSPTGYRKPAQTKRPKRKCLPKPNTEYSSDSSDCDVAIQLHIFNGKEVPIKPPTQDLLPATAKKLTYAQLEKRNIELSDKLSYSHFFGQIRMEGTIEDKNTIKEGKESCSGRRKLSTSSAAEIEKFHTIQTCKLCCDKFEETGSRIPVLLSCGHTSCKQCLQSIIDESKKVIVDYDISQLKCPTCRTVTKLGSDGVDSLKKNYALFD